MYSGGGGYILSQLCLTKSYEQVDTFAVGIMCLELLEGEPPGIEFNTFEDMDKISDARAIVFEDKAK